ncbi:hypothetical protein, partial [Tractidigestivibacter sp.]|uniref:hypothetical protein n=1 Tax=Tractidigestivibacter sp. TaxID=2847320 RepID=UPI003AF016DF
MASEGGAVSPDADGQGSSRRRMVAVGVAAAAVAVGLGVALALGAGQQTPETPEPAAEAAPTAQQATEEEPADLDEAGVEGVVESDLAYAGEDVTAEAGTAEVTAADGHAMVTQRTDDDAEARVEASVKRAAATMSALANRTVGGTEVSDVTWVMCDPEGAPKAAVRVTPESPSVATAGGASADQSVAEALAGTDGWAISTDTHDALPDPGSIPQTGGTAPTAPDGSAVAVDTTPVGSDGETDDAAATGDPAGDTSSPSQGGSSSQGNTETTGDSPSGGSSPAPSGKSDASSGTQSQPTHTHTWEPVYQSTWVQDSAAWDEPVYSTVVKYRCQACGALFDSLDEVM